MTRSRSAPTDLQLWLFLGGVGFLGIILLVIVLKPEAQLPLREMTVSCKVNPDWNVRDEPAVRNSTALPEAISIYLDISYPMGGFLPFEGNDSLSGFRSVVPLVPDHIIRELEHTTTTSIQWKSVAQELRELPSTPRIERSLFNGKETRLHLALIDLLDDLTSGRTRAAALITDLLATEELTGAIGAAKPLDDWLSSNDVRAGDFDLGLLGLRTSYWGVTHSTNCPGIVDGVGCWYSERLPGYRRLTSVAQVPFYVLLLGPGDGVVDRIGKAILADAEQLGLDAHWELLSEATKPRDTTLECTAHKLGQGPDNLQGTQFALFRNTDGSFRCARDEKVTLTCQFPQDLPVKPLSVESSWPAIVGGVAEDSITTTVDCGELRGRQLPQEDLRLDIFAEVSDARTDLWDGWSKETDETEEHLNKTLQLKYFLEKVRLVPDQYRVDCQPIFRVKQ